MSSVRIIKRRIRSAKNISQITKAMEMVAASKMRKAQEKAVKGKRYAEIIFKTAGNLAQKVDPKVHPLLWDGDMNDKKMQEKAQKQLIIIISTNRGLCGGLNTGLFWLLKKWKDQIPEVIKQDYITIGKKGQNFVIKEGNHYIADFSDNLPFTGNVGAVTKIITEHFLEHKYNEIYVAFNEFISALEQRPILKKILPISYQELINEEKIYNYQGALEREEKQKKEEKKRIFLKSESQVFSLIEPTIGEVLEYLLTAYLRVQVRDTILQAEASEHSARMMAMKNASDNATDLIDGLTLEYNKMRQQGITFEIADITTAKITMEN